MKHFTVILPLLFCLLSSIVCYKVWWQNGVIYQIYPRSFKDNDGDGVGDLNGIIQKLKYLKDTGIDNVWLSPIYKSPMYDFGYDISNFKEIHPEYGTMDDFDNLIKEASKLGMKIILDFVPNHSSNESDWFKLSANRTEGYEDYFIWADGKIDPNNPEKLIPPSNWISVVSKSAWEFNPIRGQYYLHQFTVAQPDLNYRNPLLVNEIKDILRFWLKKGVAGFRVDAIPNLFEVDPADFGGLYPDEPRKNVVGISPDQHGYLDHIYTMDLDETYDMVYQWRDVLDEFEKVDGVPRVMLSEAYGDMKLMMRYYGNDTRDGSDLPFNFQFLKEIFNDSDARDIKYVIDKWLTYMPHGKTANWVNGNHDSNRMPSRYGIERADIMNMLALILPGVAITYQGEELAMTDGEVTWEQTKDPLACITEDPINFYKVSRDPERTPFHWDDSKNAGFSSGDDTWLPVAKNYKEVNVEAQMVASKSHYKFYKDLVALKKHKRLKDGYYQIKPLTEDILAVLRYYPNESTIIGVANLSPKISIVDLNVFKDLPITMKVYTSSLNSTLIKGQSVLTENLTLSPYDAIVLISDNIK